MYSYGGDNTPLDLTNLVAVDGTCTNHHKIMMMIMMMMKLTKVTLFMVQLHLVHTCRFDNSTN
eukprot:UN05759